MRFNSMIVRLKEVRPTWVIGENVAFQFYDSPIKRRESRRKTAFTNAVSIL